ncbi:uncharacterized protein V1510DRAFT_411404 [Dipodascopsis tothii]|uniref:uncharacterized protein n=1 Tax=Dipodascopsis tothii TaxID=44089 RepID=UPI0034CEE7FD
MCAAQRAARSRATYKTSSQQIFVAPDLTMASGRYGDLGQFSPTIFSKLSPNLFFDKYISLDPPVRPSLRAPEAFRESSINSSQPLPNALGSAVVRFGDSIAVCGISGSLVDLSDIPDRKFLYTNVECHRGDRSNSVAPEDAAVSEWIYQNANGAKLFDPAQLLVADGKAVILVAQIQVLSRSAPPAGIAWAALMAALRVTKIPVARPPTEDFVPVIKFSATESTPLALAFDGQLPWCAELGVATNGLVIADPEGEIEEVSVDGRVAVILTQAPDGPLYNVTLTARSATITQATIDRCIALARARAAELDALVAGL